MFSKQLNGKSQFIQRYFVLGLLVILAHSYSIQGATKEVAPSRYSIKVGTEYRPLPYKSSHDLNVKNSTVTRLLFTIHSSSYDAVGTFEIACDMVKKAKQSGNETLILAPQFLSAELKGISTKDILHWTRYPYWGRSTALYNGNNMSLSAFDAINQILTDIVERGNYPNLETIVIMGFSAGGQMTNRYSVCEVFETNVAKQNDIEVRYIVMGPSSFTYFNDKRPVKGSVREFAVPSDQPNKRYNKWAFGVTGSLYSYHKRNRLTADIMTKRYPEKKVLFLVGSKDNDPEGRSLSRSNASSLMGRHRLERMVAYYNHLQQVFGSEIKRTQHFSVVKGAGHNTRAVMLSTPAIRFAFSPNKLAKSKEPQE